MCGIMFHEGSFSSAVEMMGESAAYDYYLFHL